MMELVLALAIGVLAASGVWLMLRPRTFQVIMGLSLLSYAVNIFIFAMGRLKSGAPPVLVDGVSEPARYADPTPQALVLTAIVIAFSGSIVGLLLSYYVNLPAGPAIVLTLGGLYVLSMIIGPLGPVLTRLRPRWHFER